MEKPSRLRHLHGQSQDQTAEQAAHQHEAAAAAPGLEFDSPEALLRHDAAENPAPPSVAERLRESFADEAPPPKTSWWRRLLGGGDGA